MKVVRTSLWINPVYDQKMKAEPGIELDILDVKGDPEVGWKQLGQAHVYQIAATKDDLPKPFFAHAELIARCPHLLVVSSNGAGFVKAISGKLVGLPASGKSLRSGK